MSNSHLSNDMTQIRIDSKEGISAAWGGVADASRVPARASRIAGGLASSAIDSSSTIGATNKSWTRALLRRVREAAIGLALITALPIAFVGMRGHKAFYNANSTSMRLNEMERFRPMRIAVDLSITPMQAGRALRALVTAPSTLEFPLIGEASSAERIWQTRDLPTGLFPQIRRPNFKGPAPEAIVQFAAAKFSADEMAYLKSVAESPIWQEYDLVARAFRVDVIGGRFVLPFRDNAFAPAMPTLRFSETKALAYAGTYRAAYYLANGQPERAENALKAIVSFGFALIDNGTSALDALTGRVIVDIGRDGLHQFYEVTGDGNSAALVEKVRGTVSTTALGMRGTMNLTEFGGKLLRDARDPNTPRALRFESLRALSFASCGTVRGMLSGPSDEVEKAYADAKTSLARYPSEAAFLDLSHDAPNRQFEESSTTKFPGTQLLLGAANVASVVLQNPRIASCTRILVGMN